MLNQIFKIAVILVFLNVGCKHNKINNQNILRLQKLNDTIVSVSGNNDNLLKIESHFSNDTLDVVDYKEDKFSSPIIVFQKLLFYNKDKLILSYNLPFNKVDRKTITGSVISTIETPVYKVCVFKDFYIINGSDYCNGSDCPEFIGIYSEKGEIIYEGFTNQEKTTALKDFVDMNKIDLNKLDKCTYIEFFN
jgi:hypothetical protein